MAKFTDVNNIESLATSAGAFYRLKEVLKAAGWTIPSSSDGTTYSAVADVVTSSTTGAGGLFNTNAWFRVQEPGGRREFVVQHTNASTAYRVKYSAMAKFTGGSPGAARVPSATDEQVIAGSGTDAAPTGAAYFNTGNHRVMVIANSTPISGVYPFQMWVMATPGSAVSSGALALEPMAPGSYDAADADPCVVFSATTIGGGNSIPGAMGLPVIYGWFAYGTGSALWSSTIAGANATFTGALPPDLVNSKDVNGRPIYTASSGGTRIKGYGSTIAIKGPPRAYPATANRATDAHVYLDDVVLPWADGVEPGV